MTKLQPVFKNIQERNYQKVCADMLAFTCQRNENTIDEIWFVEHDPVFTIGRNRNESNLLRATDIPLIHSDRGGDITYHGPGQLIVYCLMDIKRLHIGVKSLVHGLEEIVIDYLARFSVTGSRIENAPGVYVNNQKLASLGLRVRNGCAFHGLAINIDMDLTPFSYIHPCGLEGMQAVQLTQLGIQASRDQVALALSELMLKQFYS